MANEGTWRNRSKRASVIALGLVAALAGVAVAYFLTDKPFPGNYARGGELQVENDVDGLPIDFTGGGASCQTASGSSVSSDSCELLYPTNNTTDADGPKASDSAAELKETFTITNNNPVKAAYVLSASCPTCTDPTLYASPQAFDDAVNQWDHLYVRVIKKAPAAGTIPTCFTDCPTDDVVYAGRLADMTTAVNLGAISPGTTNTVTYDVVLWLANDPQQVQPQKILTNFEFKVGATLPA